MPVSVHPGLWVVRDDGVEAYARLAALDDATGAFLGWATAPIMLGLTSAHWTCIKCDPAIDPSICYVGVNDGSDAKLFRIDAGAGTATLCKTVTLAQAPDWEGWADVAIDAGNGFGDVSAVWAIIGSYDSRFEPIHTISAEMGVYRSTDGTTFAASTNPGYGGGANGTDYPGPYKLLPLSGGGVRMLYNNDYQDPATTGHMWADNTAGAWVPGTLMPRNTGQDKWISGAFTAGDFWFTRMQLGASNREVWLNGALLISADVTDGGRGSQFAAQPASGIWFNQMGTGSNGDYTNDSYATMTAKTTGAAASKGETFGFRADAPWAAVCGIASQAIQQSIDGAASWGTLDVLSLLGIACNYSLAGGDGPYFPLLPPTLEVVKALLPATDPGRFDLQVDAVTVLANAGDGSTTGPVAYAPGTYHVGEVAHAGTNLADYAVTIDQDAAPDGTVALDWGDRKVASIQNVKQGFYTIRMGAGGRKRFVRRRHA